MKEFIVGNTEENVSVKIFAESRDMAIEKYGVKFDHDPTFCFMTESKDNSKILGEMAGDYEALMLLINTFWKGSSKIDAEIRRNFYYSKGKFADLKFAFEKLEKTFKLTK